MKICEMYKIKNPTGKIKATFTIDFGHILVRDCKLIEGGNPEALWAAMPSRQYTDSNGAKKFAGIVQIKDTHIMDVITSAAREVYLKGDKEGDDVRILA
jgi:DNA-binding cell septation regulator SpoVG